MAASLHPSLVDDRRLEHHATVQATQPFSTYERYGSYSQYHLASYNAQRSTAFFGTVPRDALDAPASLVDPAQYHHPNAVPSGLVAAADDFVSAEVSSRTCDDDAHSR